MKFSWLCVVSILSLCSVAPAFSSEPAASKVSAVDSSQQQQSNQQAAVTQAAQQEKVAVIALDSLLQFEQLE